MYKKTKVIGDDLLTVPWIPVIISISGWPLISSEGVTKSKQLQSSITIASKSIYSVVSFIWHASRAFFKPQAASVRLGKKSLCTFITSESKLKYSCRSGFQLEISCLWCRTPKCYRAAACLTCLSCLSRPKPIHLTPKTPNITAHLGPLERKWWLLQI